MRVREQVSAWVVFERHAAGKPKMTVMCEQSEWDALDPVELGRCVLIRAGIQNEGEAEQLARRGAVVEKVRERPKPPVTPQDRAPQHAAMVTFLDRAKKRASENPDNASCVTR